MGSSTIALERKYLSIKPRDSSDIGTRRIMSCVTSFFCPYTATNYSPPLSQVHSCWPVDVWHRADNAVCCSFREAHSGHWRPSNHGQRLTNSDSPTANNQPQTTNHKTTNNQQPTTNNQPQNNKQPPTTSFFVVVVVVRSQS